MEKTVEIEVIEKVLMLYGFDAAITEQKSYIYAIEDNGWLKLIFRVTLASGKMLVIKILHEDDDLAAEMKKVENQSIFSELMRNRGIKTPARYQANGKYSNEFTYHDLPCMSLWRTGAERKSQRSPRT